MLRWLRQVGKIRQELLLLLGRQKTLHDVGGIMGRSRAAVIIFLFKISKIWIGVHLITSSSGYTKENTRQRGFEPRAYSSLAIIR